MILADTPVTRRRRRFLAALAAAGAFALAAAPGEARADDVSPTGKGIAGGILLGAETVVIVESIAGVRADWAYWVFGGVGAVGGGIGGYFVEQSGVDSHVPVYMLAGGMALIIPAVVLTLNATRFRPSENAVEDNAPRNVPAANPGRAGGHAVDPNGGGGATTSPPPAPTSPPPAPPPQSLLDMHRGTMRVGLPFPEMRPMFTPQQQKELGVKQQVTEVRMPLVKVVF